MSEDNYATAWELLYDRYEDKNERINYWIYGFSIDLATANGRLLQLCPVIEIVGRAGRGLGWIAHKSIRNKITSANV